MSGRRAARMRDERPSRAPHVHVEPTLEDYRARYAAPARDVLDLAQHVAVANLSLQVARSSGADVFDALEAVLATHPPSHEPAGAVGILQWYERALAELA